jgi:hypothetical protein
MGGSLSHLLEKYSQERIHLFDSIGKPNKQAFAQYKLLHKLLILFNYGVLFEIGSLMRGFEKYVKKLRVL